MTAVSGTAAESLLARRSVRSAALRWKERELVFEIRSSDPELLEMAKRVFAVRSPVATGASSRTWLVEHANPDSADSTEWLVSGRSDMESMVPATADTREMALLRIEQDALEFLLRNTPNAAAVHAALLSKEGRGVVIVGPSFAGKSTLATALWRAGWSLMADDIVFIDAEQRSASPAPRRVSLRFESRELVGDELWNEIRITPSCMQTSKGLFFHPHELSGLEKLSETQLSGIFFLARRDVAIGSAETREINPAKAALSLVPYALNIRTLPFVDALRRITPLAAAIPVFDLGRGELSAMVNAVEERVG